MVDPNDRLDAEQALKHPWFKKFKAIKQGSEEDKLDPNIVNSLRQYKGESTLKKEAMNILVKMLDTKEI